MTAAARVRIPRVPALRAPRAPRAVIVWMAAVVSVITVVALVAVAGFPTGERTPAALVGSGARVAAQASSDDVEVLLTVGGGELVAVVAYEGPKGWLGVDLEPVPLGTAAAWAATDGDGPVPALAAVYGRAPGDTVRVHWADGRVASAPTARDGAYVIARTGHVRVERVVVLDNATTVLEITDL